MSKAKKNKQILFTTVKAILFAFICWMLYVQIGKIDSAQWEQFELGNPIFLIIALAMMPANYYLEYLKWKSTLRVIGIKPEKHILSNSFMAGIVTGMLTPNMIGNFLGRMLYFPRRNRVSIVLFTMMANYAQLMATILFGGLSIIIAGEVYGLDGYDSIVMLSLVVIILNLFLYYFVEYPIRIFFKRKGYMKSFATDLKNSRWFRTEILFLSSGRYIVFLGQFSMVFLAFKVPFSFELVLSIAQLYLISILIPSLFLGKLGVRETIGLLVLGAVGVNEPAIIATSLTIWGINLVIPTLVSLFIIKRFKNAA